MKKHYPLKTVLLFCLILSNLHCTAQCWQTVGAAGRRTLAINGDGTLWAWGRNNLGSLGDGTNFHRYVPYQISTQTNWDTIAVSQNDFSFGIR